MVTDKLENCAQYCFFAGYLHLTFSLCILLLSLIPSHFNKSSPTLLQVFQSLG